VHGSSSSGDGQFQNHEKRFIAKETILYLCSASATLERSIEVLRRNFARDGRSRHAVPIGLVDIQRFSGHPKFTAIGNGSTRLSVLRESGRRVNFS
jgi:hypothetical protein